MDFVFYSEKCYDCFINSFLISFFCGLVTAFIRNAEYVILLDKSVLQAF